MKKYSITVNKKYLDKELEDKVFYVKFNWSLFFEFKNSISIDEFKLEIDRRIASYSEDLDVFIKGLEDARISCEYVKTPVAWQDPSKNITLSNRIIVKDIESIESFKDALENIKKSLLEKQIYLAISYFI